MSQSNIYAQKENGDLRLVAEIEGETDPALAVDALLDEMPRLKQRQFIVIDLDNVMVVEAGDDIIQPRRQITVTNSNSAGAIVAEPETEEGEEEGEGDEEPEAPAEEAPKPTRRRRAPKAAAKRRSTNGRKRGGTARKSPFKANPASAE
jgi:hypothetical protein